MGPWGGKESDTTERLHFDFHQSLRRKTLRSSLPFLFPISQWLLPVILSIRSWKHTPDESSSRFFRCYHSAPSHHHITGVVTTATSWSCYLCSHSLLFCHSLAKIVKMYTWFTPLTPNFSLASHLMHSKRKFYYQLNYLNNSLLNVYFPQWSISDLVSFLFRLSHSGLHALPPA